MSYFNNVDINYSNTEIKIIFIKYIMESRRTSVVILESKYIVTHYSYL